MPDGAPLAWFKSNLLNHVPSKKYDDGTFHIAGIPPGSYVLQSTPVA
jgi:hypothetical protein